MNRLTEPSYTADDLVIRSPMTFDATAQVQTLSGAVLQAVLSNGTVTVAASSVTAVITTPTTNEVIFSVWANDTLAYGIWQGQVRATKDGQTQTVAEFEVMVRQSL